jgi:dimethylhistidine N-methyltransferase
MIANKFVIFLGTSIGNLEPPDATNLLRQVRDLLGKDDFMLLGIDLKKDVEILEPAYNDAQGVTAAFNLNVLTRINRELGADFDLNRFRHVAFYNAAAGRIEMHLESTEDQVVYLKNLNCHFKFKKGETIHTENSYKYTLEGIQNLVTTAGFLISNVWYDDKRLFSLNLIVPNE